MSSYFIGNFHRLARAFLLIFLSLCSIQFHNISYMYVYFVRSKSGCSQHPESVSSLNQVFIILHIIILFLFSQCCTVFSYITLLTRLHVIRVP